MIGLLQRVPSADVDVGGATIGQIGRGLMGSHGVSWGLMVLVCAVPGDTEAEAERLPERLLVLRGFSDPAGRMNLDVTVVDGGLLPPVPQFRLAADTRRGTRPGFSTAAEPVLARRLFEHPVGRAAQPDDARLEIAGTTGDVAGPAGVHPHRWRGAFPYNLCPDQPHSERKHLSWITGVGLTPFGKHAGKSTLDLMSLAAAAALADAGLERRNIDGLLTGYSMTFPHLMLSTVFAEHFGLQPRYAHAIQLGGATGFAMAMLAHHLVDAGVADHVLVVAGENRLTGQTRDAAVQALAQVGHPRYEVPLGATIPAYYGLVATRYMHEFGVTEADFAELSVLMRGHASEHPDAQFRTAITVADVLASKPVASPLKLLDCCPVSDGGAAFVVSREPVGAAAVRIIGTGQAHTHQHISAAPNLTHFGAAAAAATALDAAGSTLDDIGYLAIYDSFTITITILLEELGLAPRGGAAALARAGTFSRGGARPLNTHGGLLSYGHCGVGGAMAHLVEAQRQLTGRCGSRQVGNPRRALLHGDGGVLSSHVTLVLEGAA